MQNFDYQTPTRLIFGKGVIEKLPGVMALSRCGLDYLRESELDTKFDIRSI